MGGRDGSTSASSSSATACSQARVRSWTMPQRSGSVTRLYSSGLASRSACGLLQAGGLDARYSPSTRASRSSIVMRMRLGRRLGQGHRISWEQQVARPWTQQVPHHLERVVRDLVWIEGQRRVAAACDSIRRFSSGPTRAISTIAATTQPVRTAKVVPQP